MHAHHMHFVNIVIDVGLLNNDNLPNGNTVAALHWSRIHIGPNLLIEPLKMCGMRCGRHTVQSAFFSSSTSLILSNTVAERKSRITE